MWAKRRTTRTAAKKEHFAPKGKKRTSEKGIQGPDYRSRGDG